MMPSESLYGQTTDTLEISQIDFEWVEKQTSLKMLKKALLILKDDGDYYPDLKKAIMDKLESLDPKSLKGIRETPIDPSVISAAKADLESFISDNSSKNLSKELLEAKEKAENEKNKGNEALRSNDLNEALSYYTKSLKYDPTLAASYYNRALVHLKLKDFKSSEADCTSAIEINPSYSKAFLRRAKAKESLNRIFEAAEDCYNALKIEPEFKEAEEELKRLKGILKPEEARKLERDEGFRRIEIMEDDEDEEEEEIEIDNWYKEAEKIKTIIKNGQYSHALELIQSLKSQIKGESKEIHQLILSLISNQCLCYKQLEMSDELIKSAKIILSSPFCDENLRIKTLLRKAIAHESLTQWHKAKRSFEKVKDIDRGNLQAAHGLQRISSVFKTDPEIEEQKKAIEPSALKEKGTKAFKSGNLDEALNYFTKASKYSKGEIHMQCLNNIALIHLNTKRFNECITTCNAVLKLESNNSKANYRKGLSLKALAEAIVNPDNNEEEIKKKIDLISEAKECMDKVLRVESENKSVKSYLEEIIKCQLKLQIDFPNFFKSKVEQIQTPNEENKKVEEQEIEEIKLKPQTKVAPNLNYEKLQEMAKEAMNSLSNSSFEVPANSSSFEKAVSAFKKFPDKLYEYVKSLPDGTLKSLYGKHDLPTDVFGNIVKVLKEKKDLEISWNFLNESSQTAKFNICIMCMTKNEKKLLSELLEEISKEKDVSNLKKLMKL